MIYIVGIRGFDFGAFQDEMEAKAFIQEFDESLNSLHLPDWQGHHNKLEHLIDRFRGKTDDDTTPLAIIEDLISFGRRTDYRITSFETTTPYHESKKLRESIRIKING